MELNHQEIKTPPRDAASVLMLRDGTVVVSGQRLWGLDFETGAVIWPKPGGGLNHGC